MALDTPVPPPFGRATGQEVLKQNCFNKLTNINISSIMTDIDTKHFKEKLEEEKKILLEELKGLGIENPEDHDWGALSIPAKGADRADDNIAADYNESFGERSATLGELEIRFQNINDALKKIDEGVYGVCETDNEPIEKDRLEANPAARTCKKHMND